MTISIFFTLDFYVNYIFDLVVIVKSYKLNSKRFLHFPFDTLNRAIDYEKQ